MCIFDDDKRSDTYSEESGQREMSKEEIILKVELNRGDYSEEIWTTDLSHDYIKINAEYRS